MSNNEDKTESYARGFRDGEESMSRKYKREIERIKNEYEKLLEKPKKLLRGSDVENELKKQAIESRKEMEKNYGENNLHDGE